MGVATKKAAFPSVEWFQALQELMNAQTQKYRRFGFVDSRGVFSVKAGDALGQDRYFGAAFEIYECVEIRELSAGDIQGFDPDWIYEGAYGDWKEMIENIVANGHADSDHTLNRLSLLRHPFNIHGEDQTRVDLFQRLLSTFQEFIDEASAVETGFLD
jgi:hypothetical protein